MVSLCTYSNAQGFKKIIIDNTSNGKTLTTFLSQIEKKYQVEFIYDYDELNAFTVTGIGVPMRLDNYLESLLHNYELVKVNDNVAFIVNSKLIADVGLGKASFVIINKTGAPQTFKGTVKDGFHQEPLIGATVSIPSLKLGDITDAKGNFEIKKVPERTLVLEFQFVGYDKQSYLVGFSKFGKTESFSINLYQAARELEGVTVTAERPDHNIKIQQTGIEKMDIKTLKSLPAFLGEVDPVRGITTLPGVTTAGELASGFNVRGGETGQNLVLQDGAPIYNPSHLFGFFSAFNPDMVNNVTLYKGGGPANFGGRISSVLDVGLRNGDATKYSVSGGVGLISSRLAVEGPVQKTKSSFLLGARISYCNWLVKATDIIELKNSSANFYDVTGKLFQKINDNNYITLSGYNSSDNFKFAADSVFKWGTTNFSLKWDHIFNKSLISAFNVYKSYYYSEVESVSELEKFRYRNSIDNLGLKYQVNYSLTENNSLFAGFEATGTQLEPGKLTPGESPNMATPVNLNDQRSIQAALFGQANLALTEKISISVGLRYSTFYRIGEDDIYHFDYSKIENRYPVISDTVHYSVNKVISKYSGFEPRVSLRYLIGSGSSIKASYYRGYQYLHLISNTTSTTPQDYWVNSGPYLKPQIGDQYSLGFFKNLSDDAYELSVEGFYKNIENAVDYIEGADITLNPSLEAGLAKGKGLAYGAELFFKKKTGKLNGWISYTYSRSLRKFSSENKNYEINHGDYYPATYDQPHILSVILNYNVGTKNTLTINFNYSTGRPITIPVSKFNYDVYLSVLNYSDRNAYRIPDYHRLDLSYTLRSNPHKVRKIKGEWVISIYNVYGRKNTYSVFFNRYGSASKMSILGTVFPSLSYNFKF